MPRPRIPARFPVRTLAGAALVALSLVVGTAAWSGSSGGYRVRPGDTLWDISRAHGLTVAQLASANHLDAAAILPIGLVLQIPGTGYQPTVGGPTRTLGAFSFCSTFRPDSAPYGVLPYGLYGSTRYAALRPLFDRWSAHYNLYEPLLEAVAWQESGWQQGVVSYTGALGVGQIEPYTARFISRYLVGVDLDVAHSASDNIRASAAFLAYLAGVEGNNTCATIAAYYEGPLNLQHLGVLPDAQQYVADVEGLIPRFS
jgi:LysM repeat protein